ncbi:protein PHLOEM PROTEIN 2-LIKE A5 [Capsella rubella]|nr:protein PHLOEM PROTEIN 2-LIKE A5 [Capsella rubella]
MAGASSNWSSSSSISFIPTGPQVFINFRGKDLRKGFISFLVPALQEKNINVFIDEHEKRGKYLISLFDRIGESKVALVIFSEGYTESKWCLNELVEIRECMDQEKLIVIPIFYKLEPEVVKRLKGNFGDKFRDLEYIYQDQPERAQQWKEAIVSVCQNFALTLPENSDKSDKDFVRLIVKEVRKVLRIPNTSKGRKGKIRENDVEGFPVPASKLTITMRETPSEEAVEVSLLNEFYWPDNMSGNSPNRKQLPEQSYEFKFWVLNRPQGNVFMIDARELSIAWSDNSNHWIWLTLPNQNPNESDGEVAYLRNVCWLDIAGKFDTRYLSPNTRYEVVFVVMLEDTTFECETPVKLKLDLPSNRENPQEWSMDMVDHITDEWIDIPVGEFTTSKKNVGEISFAMYEHESLLWKSGLYVKCVAIRPKH